MMKSAVFGSDLTALTYMRSNALVAESCCKTSAG